MSIAVEDLNTTRNKIGFYTTWSVGDLNKSSFSGVVVTKSWRSYINKGIRSEQVGNTKQSFKELCFKKLLRNLMAAGGRGIFNDKAIQLSLWKWSNKEGKIGSKGKRQNNFWSKILSKRGRAGAQVKRLTLKREMVYIWEKKKGKNKVTGG